MIQLDITITMGNDSKSMSFEEARELYNTLGQIFRNNQSFSQNDYNLARKQDKTDAYIGTRQPDESVPQHTEPVSTSAPFMNETYPNGKPVPPPNPLNPQPSASGPISRTNPPQPPEAVKTVEDRLSVEKALERARIRTSGCRSDVKSTSGCGS